MALIRRYGLYTAFAVFIIYMLYSLSFPYDDQPRKAGQGTRPRPKTFFNWDTVTIKHPLESLTPLPAGDPKALPKIQHNFGDEDPTAEKIRQARQAEVKKQFLKCWSNYRQNAWMHDEMAPISGQGKDPFGGWAATLIDAMDTLWIMKAKEEFTSAIRDIEKLNFGYTPAKTINVFETNIRHLGGLLAAYELSGDKRLLTKAKEMGEMLLHAFDTPNRMPITRWEFHEGGLGKDQTAHDNVLLAEIGSFSLEFTRLSEHTGDPKWYDAAFRITQVLERQQDSTKLPGMWPVVVNARKPDFTQDSAFTLASMSDSTYEYLVKQYALLGGRDDRYKKMYEKAMATAIKHTLYRPMTPENSDMLVSGGVRVEGNKVYLDSEFQHLVCYAGGMLALGSKLFDNPEHLTIGRKLTDSCVWGYKATQSGIMPEKSHLFKCPSTTNCTWDEAAYKAEVHAKAELKNEKDPQQNIANLRLPKGFTAIDDRRYVLRPEAIESVFIMYRITGSQAWQAAAWDMFTAIQKHTDTDIGNSALQDVSADSPPRMDDMESFWLAETLKYFYLIFSEPHYMSLDDYVYNTEAHPLKIPKPKKE